MEHFLTTKLFIPPIRPKFVARPHLIAQMSIGLSSNLTLISAPAGFGKTTLVSEWVNYLRSDTQQEYPAVNKVAWISLDANDNDPVRFLGYFVTALNRVNGIETTIGGGALDMLQSPQPPLVEAVLTSLINDVATIPDRIIIILDDYHVIDSSPVNDALSFLLEHLPPQIHLVIATREDPQLPLARLRARNQLTELRAKELRFKSSEATEFLNHAMDLDLSAEDIVALEARTEGWIAGLQLAAISMQGHKNPADLIESFTGSHRFILDYLIEEVLEQQPEDIQKFLLRTAILDRLTGPLCDALTGQSKGQQTLEYFERTNLFIVPLDNERRWYRYHHLFADLLRQRLYQLDTSSSKENKQWTPEKLHQSASTWYEDNGLELEAFHHATAANDIERTVRLIEGGGMPLIFRGALRPVLNWLESLPTSILDSYPLLWVTYASATLAAGQFPGVEQKLQAAEKALEGVRQNETVKDIFGRISATRATLAWGTENAETIIVQSNRALEYLHPDNLPFRTSTVWKLGFAHELRGDRAAANRAYTKAISICQKSGNTFINIIASTNLGGLQERENQLHLAAQTYQRILELVGDKPLLVSVGAYVGLARVLYEWDDLDAAQEHGKKSFQLARHIDSNDAFAVCGVLLARIKLSQGELLDATAILAESEQFVQQHNFSHTVPEIVTLQVLVLLRQSNLAAAANLVKKHDLPISQARVYLAQGDPTAAIAVLASYYKQTEAKGWTSECFKVRVLQTIVLQEHGEIDEAVQLLSKVLALAEPEGFVRIFIDEGQPMAQLLHKTIARGIAPEYVRQLLAAFPNAENDSPTPSRTSTANSQLIEPLSEREIEVLQLISEGLTNQEIAARLFLSLHTIKVHARNIYGKLGVSNRTQAGARARNLGILTSD